MPDLIRVSRDVYGREVLEGMSWDLIPVFFGLGLVIIVGHAVWRDNRRHFTKYYPTLQVTRSTRIRVDFLGVLFLAYLWETLEHYLEEGLEKLGAFLGS